MLYNIKTQGGPAGEDLAMDLLDTLRALRQMHGNLRMVFTGSVGLHLVLTSLKRAGHANRPVNDMKTVEVPPLELSDAEDLSNLLLSGEGFELDRLPDGMGQAIASTADGHPYYIHHIVDQIVQRGRTPSLSDIETIVSEGLTDSQDPWELSHYRERIDTYYAEEEQPFALELLDVLASSHEPLAFADIFNRLKGNLVTEDEEKALQVLTLTQRDHYVAQNSDGLFQFRFPLVKRWWCLSRGLNA